MLNDFKYNLLITITFAYGLISCTLAQSLSLEEAIDFSLKHNPKVKQYEERLAQKEYANLEATGNFLPQINLVGSYNHLNDPLLMDLSPIRSAMINLQANNQVEFANIYNLLQGNPVLTDVQRTALFGQYSNNLDTKIPAFTKTLKDQDYRTATLVGIQPLFIGGKLLAAKNYAADEEEAAVLELKQVKDEVTKETVQTYLSIVLISDVIKTRNDVLSGIKKHKEQAEKLYKEGIIANYHLLRADVAVADAEVNLMEDKNKLELALISFKNVLGLDINEQVIIYDSLCFRQVNEFLDTLLLDAQTNQPIFRILELKKDAAAQKYNVERSSFLPTISAFGKYELIPDELSALEPKWAVGIQASINLFNGLKDYSKLQSAEHLEEEIKYLQTDVKNKISLMVNKNYKDVINAEEKFKKLNSNIELAEENLNLNVKRFSTGLSTSLEVIDAQLALQKILIDRKKTLYDYFSSITELYQSIGNPLKVLTVLNKKEK